MAEKERATKMLERIKIGTNECNAVAVQMMNKTRDFIEDIFNEHKINNEEYNNMRLQIKTLSNKFSSNCGCMSIKR